jgi:putative FmdB family regulatory protein
MRLPLYEYQCPKCGRFEIIRKFSDSPLLACPTCGGEIQRLASAPAIQFKGTGWYVTDYARKSSGGDGSAAAKASGSKDGEASGVKSSGGEASGGSKDSSSSSGTAASGSSKGGAPGGGS